MSSKSAFPPARMDTTLHDLLVADFPDTKDVNETLCHVKPTSDTTVGSAVIINNKYLLTSAQSDDGSTLAHLQLEICSYLLMFFAGPMDIILIAADSHLGDDNTLSKASVHANALRSFAVIAEDQRPRVYTFANVDDMLSRYEREFQGKWVRWGFGIDFAEKLPYVFDPKLTYLLNSKRFLADDDGMKSANDIIIDCGLLCESHQTPMQDARKKCWYYGGDGCKHCQEGIKSEIDRVMDLLNQRYVPYVLKLNQSLSSVGTNIVVTEADRPKTLKVVLEHLDQDLRRITKENAFLYPTSLIMSDLIDSETTALNFYVRGGAHSGEVIFLGACEQLATGQGGRQTTMIRYAEQDRLEKRFRETLNNIGKALSREGYYGAAGADVMEDPKGRQVIIDLNVRTALSHVLYLLKGHLNKERGYGMAVIYECLVLKCNRDKFEERMNKELWEAKVIIVGCTGLANSGKHAYGLVVAGEGKNEIDQVSEKIFEWEA